MHRLALIAAALLLPAATTPPIMGPPPPSPPPPPLVITIQADGLTGELFDTYRPFFTGGLKRLAAGTVFRNGYQGSGGAQSLGTILKRLSPDSQNVVVSVRSPPASAIGSEQAVQRWYWDGNRFATDAARSPRPRTPALANAAVTAMIASAEAPLDIPPACSPMAANGTRFARGAGDRAGFSASPALDGATLALAAGLIGELGLGRDRAPDVVSVRTGSGDPRQEACLRLFSLDRDLGGFFDALDRAGIYYAVALSGGDGGTGRKRVPLLFWRAGMAPTERMEAAETGDTIRTLGAMLNIPLPATAPGKCLAGVQGIACPSL